MLTLTRLQAERIRSVFRQAFGLRQKLISVPIVLTGAGDHLQVRSHTDVLAARVTFAGEYQAETIAVPWDLLRECAGRRDDPVVVERMADGRISASFQDHGIPVINWYDPIQVPSPLDDFPALPERCRDNYPELLTALQHAVDVTNNSSTRYALDHLRLRGSDGSIAATDGRQLLVQTGFEFRWEEDVLVPGMHVFGQSELQGHQTISLGKQGDWVTLLIGPWAFGLKCNHEGRFPKIEDNLRRPDTALASLTIAEPDAKFLAEVLPRLPSQDSSHSITLELNGSISLRARPEGAGNPTEVVLRQSNWTGSNVRINSDRRFLATALRFGLRELSIFNPDTPLLCHDLRRSYVWMPLAADQAIPPRADCVRIESPAGPQAATPPTISQRMRTSMPPTAKSVPSVNGNHASGHALSTPSRDSQTVGELPSAIEQACQLRDTLHTAAQQAGALVRELKKDRKRTKSLRSTLLSLKQLQAVDA